LGLFLAKNLSDGGYLEYYLQGQLLDALVFLQILGFKCGRSDWLKSGADIPVFLLFEAVLLLQCLAARCFPNNAFGGFGAVELVDLRVSESFKNSGDLPFESGDFVAGSKT
jgi:hypothetical protein